MSYIKNRIQKVEDEVFKDKELNINVKVLDPFPSEAEQIVIEEANPDVKYIWVTPINYDPILYHKNVGNTYQH